jgi:hypothetical protein
MNQALTLQIPEELYEPLVKIAQQKGQSPEEFAEQWLAASVQHFADDPLEPFIGSVQSNISDWTQNHDRYLGDSFLSSGNTP